mmetsp:Transcript_56729/g.112653  ORF Transcript_56729/g.112653 Transcript_56729/m.112653 type:complete len:226 (-) Transcript_56729:1304-1981(-)
MAGSTALIHASWQADNPHSYLGRSGHLMRLNAERRGRRESAAQSAARWWLSGTSTAAGYLLRAIRVVISRPHCLVCAFHIRFMHAFWRRDILHRSRVRERAQQRPPVQGVRRGRHITVHRGRARSLATLAPPLCWPSCFPVISRLSHASRWPRPAAVAVVALGGLRSCPLRPLRLVVAREMLPIVSAGSQLDALLDASCRKAPVDSLLSHLLKTAERAAMDGPSL